ncbi:MAG: transporter substrate-binding domain-containing protein [Clostridia bacterium]|nr:transporter substrate-binding domain-containing protein [Clostridia bacterium]
MQNVLKYKARFTACVKIISAFIACLIFFLSNFFIINSVTARADEAQSGSATVETVKAGVFEFPGYHMKDENDRLTGYGIEFLNLVSKYSHLNFEYTAYNKSWDDMLTMLENEEIDVVTSASWTEEREAKFDFSLPIGRKNTVLSIRSDETDFISGDYNSYKGMKVGLIRDNTSNNVLKEFAEKKDFTYEEVYRDNAEELATLLQEGKIDAIISSDLRKQPDNEKTLDIIGTDDFYAIVKDGDPKGLLPKINSAIHQMDINEGDWKNVLFYKYYGPDYSSEPFFTADELDYIRQVALTNKTITVTALGNNAPYSYIENGELKGIMPDYFAEVMKIAERSAGLTESLPYTLVATDSDGVNVILDSTGADDIKEGFVSHGFNTDSYMTARMARVTRQDHKGEIKVVALAAAQFKEQIEHEGYTVVSYPTGEEAMRAVLNRNADAAYVYSYAAQWFINHDHTNSLYYSSVNGMSTSFSMHISENTDHELITILNKCIKQMSDEELNQLASKYTSFTIGDMDFWQYLMANPAIIIAVVIILAIIAGVILVLYLRGRWNRKLLYATEQSNKKMGEQLSIVQALSRDYTNVYSVDVENATAQILKLEGYVTEGLKKGSAEEYNYAVILENYIRARVHPDDREELSQALSLDTVRDKLNETDEYQGSYRIEENGEIHHLQYSYIKISNNDPERSGFILAGFRNIDEVIRKEQAQKNVLAEALAQAQYANKSKTTFLNSMSHDIRTPMNAIIGFTSLASNHIDNKEQVRDYLGKIMTSGNHLLSLINDVLDMSRIESGKVKIEEKETSLPEIMNDLKTIVQADVKAKQLKFDVDILNVTNETIICDKLRLNQVLINLLSNAIKYNKPNGTVSVRVTQKAEAQGGYASYEFSVKDTGIGMSSEFLKHVFEPFEREQTSTVSGIQGTGLGLAITKNIVDLMGGTISVESEAGKGSEFIVTFCFRVAESPAQPQQKEQESADGKNNDELRFDGKRILLVEDNELNQEIAQSILEDVGFIIDTADDGSVAVERMKETPAGTYDLILMDVQMPIMNGYEATRAIRALDDPAKATTPIVAMTANAFDEDRKAAMDAGMDGFASKPIDIEKLMTTLKDILK